MSSINSVSPGSFPIIPQQTGNTGTIPARGEQATGVQSTGQAVPPDQLQRTLDRMNQHLAGSDHSVRIDYASSVHQLMVQVVDNSTGQVVGQFPSKAALASEAAMNQFIGIMLSREV